MMPSSASSGVRELPVPAAPGSGADRALHAGLVRRPFAVSAHRRAGRLHPRRESRAARARAARHEREPGDSRASASRTSGDAAGRCRPRPRASRAFRFVIERSLQLSSLSCERNRRRRPHAFDLDDRLYVFGAVEVHFAGRVQHVAAGRRAASSCLGSTVVPLPAHHVPEITVTCRSPGCECGIDIVPGAKRARTM